MCTIFFIFKACLDSIMQWKRDKLKRYGGLYCSRKRMLNSAALMTVCKSLRWYTGWSVHPKWSFWTENNQVKMISPTSKHVQTLIFPAIHTPLIICCPVLSVWYLLSKSLDCLEGRDHHLFIIESTTLLSLRPRTK